MVWRAALIVVISGLMGCSSLFERRTQQDQAKIQDVPFYARGSNGVKKRILILPFLDEQINRSQKAREAARHVVVLEILKSQAFVVVKNDDFPQDLSKFITEENEYDLEALARTANGMGIAAVVEGKILEVSAKKIGDQVGIFREVKAQVEASVRIRLASSKNARIVLDDVRHATVEAATTRIFERSFSDRYLQDDPKLVSSAVVKAFLGSIRNMILAVDKLSWEGRVAMVSGDRVYVNAGRLSGLQIGDLLKVTEDGNEIFDPESGKFIGHAPGRMKGTLEIISYFGKDGAEAVVHSGSGFQENDKVEIY